MWGSRALFLAIVVIACAGCADPRRKAEDTLGSVGAERLRQDAAVIYKNAFAARAPDFEAIKPSDYPASFRRFSPRHVGAYPDGVSIALEKNGAVESGLYLVPHSMDRAPVATPRASFEKITEGVYWYSFQD